MEQEESRREEVITKLVLLAQLEKRVQLLQARFACKYQALEVERASLYAQCMALKQKMELIHTYREKGHYFSNTLLDSVVQAQSLKDPGGMATRKRKLAESQAHLASLEAASQGQKEMKERFRALAGRFLEDEALLAKAKAAYVSNDLQSLAALESLPATAQKPAAYGSLLAGLEADMRALLGSFWIQQEENLLEDSSDWFADLLEDIAWYTSVKKQMESLIVQTGHA